MGGTAGEARRQRAELPRPWTRQVSSNEYIPAPGTSGLGLAGETLGCSPGGSGKRGRARLHRLAGCPCGFCPQLPRERFCV